MLFSLFDRNSVSRKNKVISYSESSTYSLQKIWVVQNIEGRKIMVLYLATSNILMYFHFRFFPLYVVLFAVLVVILNLYMVVFHLALFSLLFSHISHLVVATNILLIKHLSLFSVFYYQNKAIMNISVELFLFFR